MLIYKIAGGIYAFTTFTEAGAILLVLVAIFRLKLWRYLPFYYLATANLINDFVMTLVHLIYMTPAVLSESFIFEQTINSIWVKFFSFCYVTTWYAGCVLDLIIAFERLFMIKRWSFAFSSRETVFWIAVFAFIVAISVNATAFMISPCCRFLLNWEYFGYAFYNPNNMFNYTDSIIDLPLNIVTSSISLICYTWIGFHILFERKRISSGEAISFGRKRDYTLAINYGVIALLFTTSWLMLRIFDWVFHFKYQWMLAITPFMVMLKCSANALIFLKNNKQIRRDIKQMVGCRIGRASNNTVNTSQSHTRH